MNTITLEMRAAKKVAPDTMSIEISIEERSKEFADIAQELNRKANLLVKRLLQLPLTEGDLTIKSYEIRDATRVIEYKKYYEKKHSEYIAAQKIIINKPKNLTLLNLIINALNEFPMEIGYRVAFSLENPDSVYDELIAEIAKKARRKAQILAEHSDVKLGKIVSISNAEPEYDFTTTGAMAFSSSASDESFNEYSLNVEDVELELEFTFVFEIL